MGEFLDFLKYFGRAHAARIGVRIKPKHATYWCRNDSDGEHLGNLGRDRKYAVRCIADDIEAFLEEAADGEEYTVTVGRTDMTQEEEDAIPEL